MRIESEPYSGKSLPFYLRRSTYVHAILFSLTLIGGKVISIQQAKMLEKNMELVQASVRVDMVAMPKYTLNELKNLSSGVEEAKKEEPTPTAEPVKKEEPKPEPVKEEPKPEPKVVEKEPTPSFEEVSKQKHENFLSKLKQIGNKKIKSEGTVKAEKGAYGDKTTALKDLVLSGNKLSKGVAIYGDGNAAEMTAFQAYAGRLPDYVRPHWSLPSFLAEKKNLKCRVRIWLAADGTVTRAEVYQASTEPEYDQRAVDAVKASRFPPLKEEISKRAQAGNIVLGFPL